MLICASLVWGTRAGGGGRVGAADVESRSQTVPVGDLMCPVTLRSSYLLSFPSSRKQHLPAQSWTRHKWLGVWMLLLQKLIAYMYY